MNKTIIMDTREKTGKKDLILNWFEQNGVKVVRSKLYVGDWSFLHNQTLCIDTKQDLKEVYGNLVQSHERFRAELVRAKEAGIKLVVLVEEKGIETVDDVQNWTNPRQIIYERMKERGDVKLPKKPPISSKRLMLIMKIMSENYGVEWRFCRKEKTGETILRILEENDGSQLSD